MNDANPIDLLFGGMDKLGPGSNVDTLKVLDMLPEASYRVIVDAGCGAGRQTLALAGKLQRLVHAVDSYQPFLVGLTERAREAGLAHLVQTHCMDMADIPGAFPKMDLLWSEGAAYNIGSLHALKMWYPAIKPGGFVVFSELSWLRKQVPDEVRQFFQSGYPDMRSVDQNRAVAQDSGYEVHTKHTLSPETWVEDYYSVLEPRAKALLDHSDQAVREFAAETIEEIRIFGRSEGSYGYVFYVMQKPNKRHGIRQ